MAALACLVAPAGGARHATATSGSLTPLAAEAHELDLLNGQRGAVGLAPVIMDPRLQAIAEQRSMNMATLHYFSHTQPDGRTALSMIEAAGIEWSAMGEIIEWNAGYGSWGPSADEAATDWHDSPPHYAIITTAAYTAAGIGVAYDATSGRTLLDGRLHQGPAPAAPAASAAGSQPHLRGRSLRDVRADIGLQLRAGRERGLRRQRPGLPRRPVGRLGRRQERRAGAARPERPAAPEHGQGAGPVATGADRAAGRHERRRRARHEPAAGLHDRLP